MEYLTICEQYLTAHLRRVVREGVAAVASAAAAAAGNDSVTSSPVPPVGHDSKQVFYAKYCLRHIASPRTHTRKLPPSNIEIEVEHPSGYYWVTSQHAISVFDPFSVCAATPSVFRVFCVYVFDRQTLHVEWILMKF